MSRNARAVALCTIALGLSACSEVAADRSGGGVATETVVLAYADAEGSPAGLAAADFAERLADESGGHLVAEPSPRAHLGDDADDPEAFNNYPGIPYDEVRRQLTEGEVELALVPDFSWLVAGAPGIGALKVPFVIDSDALMLAIADELGAESTAGVRELGAEPLALLPESIRHPVGFGTPLQTLADYDDRRIRITDPALSGVLTDLGAEPLRLEREFPKSVADGSVTGAESAFAQTATLPATGIFTADVALGAKFNVLAATGRWYDALSDQQREWIAAAAHATLTATIDGHRSDAELGAAYCDAGGWVVHAGEAVRADFAARRDSAIRDAEDDPDSGPLLARILALSDDVEARSPAGSCTPETSTFDPPLPGSATALFPEGTYRATLTVEDFTSVGVDLATARNHAEVWTLTFRDGVLWDMGCEVSTYTASGGRVSVMLGTSGGGCGDIPGKELFNARWTLIGDDLRFTDFGPTPMGPAWQTFNETLWGAHDWVRVR